MKPSLSSATLRFSCPSLENAGESGEPESTPVRSCLPEMLRVWDGLFGSRLDDFCRFRLLKASGNPDLSYSPSQQVA